MEKRFQVPIEAELNWYGVAVEMWVEVVLTSEGIIVDVYRNDDDDMADCMATGAHTWDELELTAPLNYEDGITITANGNVIGSGEHNPQADTKLKKQANAYADLYTDALPLDKPGPGDCWYCHLMTDAGKPLGDAVSDTGHLLDHIAEGYIVPSLAYNALKERYNAPMAFYDVFNEDPADNRWFGKSIIKRAVSKYILSRLGYAV
jgi:hypothetical protein